MISRGCSAYRKTRPSSNHKGFNNEGVRAAAKRLQKSIALNIIVGGKQREE